MNFNEDSYTAAESDGQISLSFRIDGKFFVPVWAIVEIIDGTATGRCAYKSIGLIFCAYIYRHLTSIAIIFDILESIKVFNSCTVSLPM